MRAFHVRFRASSFPFSLFSDVNFPTLFSSTPNCETMSATVDVSGPIAIANLTTVGPGANETISIICSGF